MTSCLNFPTFSKTFSVTSFTGGALITAFGLFQYLPTASSEDPSMVLRTFFAPCFGASLIPYCRAEPNKAPLPISFAPCVAVSILGLVKSAGDSAAPMRPPVIPDLPNLAKRLSPIAGFKAEKPGIFVVATDPTKLPAR